MLDHDLNILDLFVSTNRGLNIGKNTDTRPNRELIGIDFPFWLCDLHSLHYLPTMQTLLEGLIDARDVVSQNGYHVMFLRLAVITTTFTTNGRERPSQVYMVSSELLRMRILPRGVICFPQLALLTVW